MLIAEILLFVGLDNMSYQKQKRLLLLYLLFVCVCFGQDSLWQNIVYPKQPTTNIVVFDNEDSTFAMNFSTREIFFRGAHKETDIILSTQGKYFIVFKNEEPFLSLFDYEGRLINSWEFSELNGIKGSIFLVSDFDGSIIIISDLKGIISLINHQSNTITQQYLTEPGGKFINCELWGYLNKEGDILFLPVMRDFKKTVAPNVSSIRAFKIPSLEIMWHQDFSAILSENEDVSAISTKSSASGFYTFVNLNIENISENKKTIVSLLLNNKGEIIGRYDGLQTASDLVFFNEEQNQLYIQSHLGKYTGEVFIDLDTGKIVDWIHRRNIK